MSKHEYKAHYVRQIIPVGNNGWSACGQLIPARLAVSDIQDVTCLSCQRAIGRQDRRDEAGFPPTTIL